MANLNPERAEGYHWATKFCCFEKAGKKKKTEEVSSDCSVTQGRVEVRGLGFRVLGLGA